MKKNMNWGTKIRTSAISGENQVQSEQGTHKPVPSISENFILPDPTGIRHPVKSSAEPIGSYPQNPQNESGLDVA